MSTEAAPAAARAFIGLGANLGDARAQVEQAIHTLATWPGIRLVARSSMYRSAPVNAGGPDYVNAVVAIDSSLSPRGLLQALQTIETRFGRERPYPNAPRTLDLDLLLYGDKQLAHPELTVPHPRMHQRAFVLRPLAELAPDWVLPGFGSVASLLPAVADQAMERLP